jgi:zinc D-Ala-D-Ala dipeptidase
MVPPPSFADVFKVVPDAIPDIRYATPNNITGRILPGYSGPKAWCDEVMVPILVDAAAELRRQRFRLIVFDAYRPHRAALAMGQWARDTDQHWLLEGYISEVSRHCKGIAIDVGLATANGAIVDMGSGFDVFGVAGHTLNAEGRALEHRLILKEAMCGAGFEDYRKEWWHFDLPKEDRALRDEPYL